jgi:hypothetical protein
MIVRSRCSYHQRELHPVLSRHAKKYEHSLFEKQAIEREEAIVADSRRGWNCALGNILFELNLVDVDGLVKSFDANEFRRVGFD